MPGDSKLPEDPSTLSGCNPSRDCLFWLSVLRSTLGDSGGIIYDDALGVMEALGVPSELNSEMPALMGLASSLLVVLMLLTPVIKPPDRLPLAPTLMAFTLRAPGVLQASSRGLIAYWRLPREAYPCSKLAMMYMLQQIDVVNTSNQESVGATVCQKRS